MSIPKPVASLNWSVEQLTRASNVLEIRDSNDDTVTDRIHTAMDGHPRAARWDTAATANRPWCWTHQREVSDCHRAGETCLADDIVGSSDPTGDAAAAKKADQASTDLHNIDRITRAIKKQTEELIDLLERYPAPRPATLFERSISADNAIGCESCARVPDNTGRPLWGEPILTRSGGNPTRMNPGNLLTAPMYLCQRCYSHIQGKGILPPRKELEGQVKDKNDRRHCQCDDRREVWSNGEITTGGTAA